jgi:hypothetical protein
MSASAFSQTFESQYGVIYRAYLRDGAGFSGKAKRAARELGELQDEKDQELFLLHGGLAKVQRRLLSKWNDESQSLTLLSKAEDRLLVMLALDQARLAAMTVVYVNELLGHGLQATQPIRAHDFIGEYTGVLREEREGDEHNRYLASTKAYGELTNFLIDGQDEGNLTRFINHSFTAPNVRSEHAFHNLRWHRILRAERDIQAGEALLWNYGMDYWKAREAPAEL